MNAYELLLVLLAKNDIEFITIGGMACAFHGYLRTTDDVDLLIARRPENLRRLIKVLSEYGEGYARELTQEDFTDEEGCIRIIEYFPIDIFTRIGHKTNDDYKSSICYFLLNDVRIPFLDKANLIEIKRHSLSPQDQIDVIQLMNLPDNPKHEQNE